MRKKGKTAIHLNNTDTEIADTLTNINTNNEN